MNARSTARGTDDDGTWTSETLPISLRRELLERELAKLGFRKAGQATSSHDGPVGQQQQQSQGGSSDHPPADDPGDHVE